MNEELVSLSVDAGAAPETVPLFKYGKTTYRNPDGSENFYEFDEGNADLVAAQYALRGVDGMIDYNHQQLRAKTNGQPAPAAGWITGLIKTASGLDAAVKWTERAKQYLADKEYRYTSPLFYKDKATNHVTRLINLALTNIPGTDCQEALVALQLDTEPTTNHLKGGKTMNKKMFELVGLEMPEAEDQQLVALESAISALVTEKATLTTENATLKAQIAAKQQREEVVALEAAIADGLAKGKLTNDSAAKLRGKTLSEVQVVLEMIPENAAVPLQRAEKGAEQEVVALSPEDVAYCVQHGYDQTEFAQAKKK